jgi:formylglycine-generating enzyme required for sulfatase activity
VSDHPTKIGKYQIRGLLGGGGMAKVYEAYDPVGDRVLAVKVLKDEFANAPEVVASFVQEAKKAIRLENHDSVLTVYEVDQDGDTPFIAMRRVEGQTLQEEMRKRGVLPVDRVRGIVAGVGGALEHAHQRGIVHCDVKPSNIMLDRVGRSYLMDFGISRAIGDLLGARLDQLSAYTPQYASPEQTKGQPATVRSDIYSFGVVLYEMVTGTTPYGHCQGSEALRHAVVHETTCPPRDVNPNVPEALQQVILRALAKDPVARFDTMAQFMEAVLDATDEKVPAGDSNTADSDATVLPQRGATPPTSSSPAPTPLAEPAQARGTQPEPAAAQPAQGRAVAILAAVAVIAAGGVFGWDWWQKSRKPAHSEQPNVSTLAAVDSTNPAIAAESPSSTGNVADKSPTEAPPRTEPTQTHAPTGEASSNMAAPATTAGDKKDVAAESPDNKTPVQQPQQPAQVTPADQTSSVHVPTPDKSTPPAKQPEPSTSAPEATTAARPEAATKPELKAHPDVAVASPPAPLPIHPALLPRTRTLPADWQVDIVDPTPGPLTSLPRRVRDAKTGIELILVEPAQFAMGSPTSDQQARIEETPQHQVTLTQPYYLGATEVTVGQWRRYVGDGGSAAEGLADPRKRGRLKTEAAWGDDHPVVYVSPGEAAAFCSKYGFRLPTEAQWELACRAGTTTTFWFGKTALDAEGHENVFGDASKEASKEPADGALPGAAWPIEDGFLQTAPAGRFAANAWGFHDMAGNVREWCADPFVKAAYVERKDGADDPFPTASGEFAVARGGSWCSEPLAARSAARHAARGRTADIGFRVARTVR